MLRIQFVLTSLLLLLTTLSYAQKATVGNQLTINEGITVTLPDSPEKIVGPKNVQLPAVGPRKDVNFMISFRYESMDNAYTVSGSTINPKTVTDQQCSLSTNETQTESGFFKLFVSPFGKPAGTFHSKTGNVELRCGWYWDNKVKGKGGEAITFTDSAGKNVYTTTGGPDPITTKIIDAGKTRTETWEAIPTAKTPSNDTVHETNAPDVTETYTLTFKRTDGVPFATTTVHIPQHPSPAGENKDEPPGQESTVTATYVLTTVVSIPGETDVPVEAKPAPGAREGVRRRRMIDRR